MKRMSVIWMVLWFGLSCPGMVLGDEGGSSSSAGTETDGETIDLSEWELVWEDDFDYPDAQLDERWESQNGPSHHILCSRWRENVVVRDGVLHLINRKENRGGQAWTSGSIWTKRKFKYGYFECRYRYAEDSAGIEQRPAFSYPRVSCLWCQRRGVPRPAVGDRGPGRAGAGQPCA